MQFLLQVLSWAWVVGFTLAQKPLSTGNLRGDPGDLHPIDLLKVQGTFPPRPTVQQTQRLALPLFLQRGDPGELAAEESRGNAKRQSYNRHYKARPTHYNKMNRHSDEKKGKGGHHRSDSYNGQSGYSTKSSYDRAKKDNYGDADHRTSKKGDGRHHGQGQQYGGSSAGHRFLYGDNDDYYK